MPEVWLIVPAAMTLSAFAPGVEMRTVRFSKNVPKAVVNVLVNIEPSVTGTGSAARVTTVPEVKPMLLETMPVTWRVAPLEMVAELVGAGTRVIVAHERTPFTEAALLSGQIDALITQDPGHLVRSAIRILRARCDNREVLASQEKIRIEILIRENL